MSSISSRWCWFQGRWCYYDPVFRCIQKLVQINDATSIGNRKGISRVSWCSRRKRIQFQSWYKQVIASSSTGLEKKREYDSSSLVLAVWTFRMFDLTIIYLSIANLPILDQLADRLFFVWWKCTSASRASWRYSPCQHFVVTQRPMFVLPSE